MQSHAKLVVERLESLANKAAAQKETSRRLDMQLRSEGRLKAYRTAIKLVRGILVEQTRINER